MTKKPKTETKKWTIFPQADQVGEGATITQESVKGFRDGLAKFQAIDANPGLIKTLAYRAMLDLDHLLRLMQSHPSTIIATYQFTVTPKDKKSAKKMAVGKWKKA
jgi:hypothetical protein